MVQPTLLGTWETVFYDRDDEGTIDAKETVTLTLTETHFFELNHVQDRDGRTRYRGDQAGSVSYTDTTVTKAFVYDRDGVQVPMSVEKEYYLASNGEVLFIHHWYDDESTTRFDQFTRVAAAPMADSQPSMLRGTWQQVHAWDDDEDGWIEQVRTLTFTGTRFIVDNARSSTDDGEFLFRWSDEGGWADNGTSVTTIRFEDGQEHSVDKQYVLAGDLLAINPWWDDNPNQRLEVFTRVQDPMPGGVLGSWTCEVTYTTRDGKEGHLSYSFTFGESSFVEDFDRTGKTFDLAGSPRYDDENNFIFVTVQQAALTLDGSTAEGFDLTEWIGHEIRYAWAPTGRPDQLVLSGYWRELEYDDGTKTWKEHEEYPYGSYYLLLGRQATTMCWS